MRRPYRSQSATKMGRSVALVALALAMVSVSAAAEDGEGSARRAPTQKPVPLDLLLRLPTGSSFEVETYGGQSRAEWRSRFTLRTRERDEAKEGLTESQEELSKIASKAGGWNLGTPGTGAGSVDSDTPLSFELNQKIRRLKKELAEAEEKLESLRVEANLAHVPQSWREPDAGVEKTAVSEDW